MRLFSKAMAWAMAATAAVVAQQQEALSFTDPRPALQATLEIERRYGVPVHYEDPRYGYFGDLEDITDKVLTTQQRALADPKKRIIVPAQKTIHVFMEQRAAAMSPPDVRAALTAARAVVAASSDLNTSFQVTEANGSIFFAGVASRDNAGKRQTYTPILSTRVTLTSGRRTALEALGAIQKEVSDLSGFRMDLGSIPIRLLAESEVHLGAQNEAANLVIDKLLRALPLLPSVSSTDGRATVSYKLLFDPRSRVFALNITAASQGSGAPEEGIAPVKAFSSSDRFFKKN
jgi:hypothetical protein